MLVRADRYLELNRRASNHQKLTRSRSETQQPQSIARGIRNLRGGEGICALASIPTPFKTYVAVILIYKYSPTKLFPCLLATVDSLFASFHDHELTDANELLEGQRQHHQLPRLHIYMQVLEGFVKKDNSAMGSWTTGDSLDVTPTGWSERTYDIKFLYGSSEVKYCMPLL